MVKKARTPLIALYAGFLLLGTTVTPVSAGKPVPPPTPPVRYAITLVDATPDSSVEAINETGNAVGHSEGRAVMWLENGEKVDLTELAQDANPEWILLDYAYEINEIGQIAGRGWRVEDGDLRARLFRYSPQRIDPDTQEVVQPSTIEAIRAEAGNATLFVEGLNDLGDVLLHVTSRAPTFPSIPTADDSAWVFSGSPGFGVSELLLNSAVPSAINNSRQVTGAINTGTRSCAFCSTPGGSMELFGTISGATSSQYQVSDGLDINDFGIVAGWSLQGKLKSREDTSKRIVRLRADGKWEDLVGTGANNWATAINDSGETVGNASGANMVGSLFTAGKLYALRDLLTNTPTGLKYINPVDISNRGEICGQVTLVDSTGSSIETGVILTPVP